MQIIPAIDLKEGKAVRLIKGEMNSAKIYSNEPSDLAKSFEDLGANYLHNRVILGSVALKEPEFTKQMAKLYKIVVGIDLNEGKVATHGWVNISHISGQQLAASYKGAGLEAIITTDISKDGTLSGVNAALAAQIADASATPTIASGGVRDIDDIHALLEYPQISGVIVGKAYYEGTINLKDAFKLAKSHK